MNARILIPAIASLAFLAGGPAFALAPAGAIDGLRIEKATPVVEACVRRQTNPPMQQIRQFSYAYPVPRDSRDPGHQELRSRIRLHSTSRIQLRRR